MTPLRRFALPVVAVALGLGRSGGSVSRLTSAVLQHKKNDLIFCGTRNGNQVAVLMSSQSSASAGHMPSVDQPPAAERVAAIGDYNGSRAPSDPESMKLYYQAKIKEQEMIMDALLKEKEVLLAKLQVKDDPTSLTARQRDLLRGNPSHRKEADLVAIQGFYRTNKIPNLKNLMEYILGLLNRKFSEEKRAPQEVWEKTLALPEFSQLATVLAEKAQVSSPTLVPRYLCSIYDRLLQQHSLPAWEIRRETGRKKV